MKLQNLCNEGSKEEGCQNEAEDYAATMRVISNCKQKLLPQDISLDLLVSLVHNKILQSEQRPPAKSRISFAKKLVFAILVSVVSLCIATYIFGPDRSMFNSQLEGKRFTFIPGEAFRNQLYFGKQQIMRKVVSDITKMVDLIETANVRELQSKLQATLKNFLLFGEPGTGKTAFVEKLAFYLDLNLRCKMACQKNPANWEKLPSYLKMSHIAEMEPQVYYCLIKPSDIGSKYVGESEGNIKRLWAQAEEFNKPLLLLFDEIDSFCSKREVAVQEHTIKTKTELLNFIGGGADGLHKKIFVFGCTNMYETIDKAFKRRFCKKIHFKMPDDSSRKDLIKNLSQSFGFNDDDIEELTRKSDNCSQAKIRNAFTMASFNNGNEPGVQDIIGWLNSISDDEGLPVNDYNEEMTGHMEAYLYYTDIKKDEDKTAASLLPMDEQEFQELKENLDKYVPIIPDTVLEHYMEKSGLTHSDQKVKKLVSLMAHKFVTDVSTLSFQYHKIHQKAAQKDKRFAREKKPTFHLVDLEKALEDIGINVSRPHYFM